MASIQTASVSTLAYLQRKNKITYVSLVVLLSIFLLLDYIPGYSTWVTPPVALFLGLIFALSSGQAHPKFNKKVSKYLLQYSVVGLGFGMNLQASLASGKEGMEFTVISVVGTMLIGWFIGRKFLKVDRDTSYLISSGTAICGGSAHCSSRSCAESERYGDVRSIRNYLYSERYRIVYLSGYWSCPGYEPAGIWNMGSNCYT